MAKYIIAFAVLILLIAENNSIFKRLYVESLPSSRQDATIHIRNQQQLHRDSIDSPHSSHHHHRHKRIHHTRQKHKHNPSNAQHVVNSSPSDSDSSVEMEARLAERLLRHRIHQLEHLEQHQEHYQRRTRSSSIDNDKYTDLRSMPRPWTRLMDDENMYADEPMMSDEKSEDIEYPDDDRNDLRKLFDLESNRNDESDIDNSESVESPPETFENHIHNSNEVNAGYRCPKCEVARKVEHISEEELTRLRIEFVKTQILEKLRIKERPNVSAVSLPKPIQEGVTIDQGDEDSKNKDLDDYYARTSKKFIFLERETRECERTGVQPSICFSFKIDDADADGFDVNTAVLWIFKNKIRTKPVSTTQATNSNNTLRNQETLVVSEVQQPVDQKFRPIVKTIAIQTVVDQNKWLEIDIEWPIKRWFGNHDLSHLIQISCESCDISSIEDMISIDKDYRPFIVIDTQNRRRASRRKRGINCTDGVTECCREKLYISFDEIGWGDWIIQPRGYDAYFCRGSCASVASVAQAGSSHNTVIQKYNAMKRTNRHDALELIPCCTAKQYSSLQIMFMDSNNTAAQKTFPNMVVESCGCR